MKKRLRAVLMAARGRLLAPVMVRFDGLDDRLVEMERRLDDIEAVVRVSGARASSATERDTAVVEREARLDRRIREIEQLLGVPAADR